MVHEPQFASAARTPASGERAPASSLARTAGSARAALRSGSGLPITSAQPGSASKMKPLIRLRRIFIGCGSVSATTFAPRAAAWSLAASWALCMSGIMELGFSRFQFTARSPASANVVMRAFSSSVKLPTPGRNSSRVPGNSFTTLASANSSSSVAWREGTGLPSASLCVGDTVLEKPSPPAAIDSRSSCCMAAISASVAWLPTARAPIT